MQFMREMGKEYFAVGSSCYYNISGTEIAISMH